jgi:radical SAM protein with 4Fe4S-binding SPASM domain
MTLAQQLLRKVPQYTRHERHIRSVVQHGTPRKWANLAHAEIERIQRKIKVNSRPYLLFIDPCNFCNLRCPLCPTGLNDLGREQTMLGFEDFERWFEPHKPYLFEAYLHNWGESLLNKQVFRMIDHVQRSNVGTNLSSNLVIATSEDLDNLIDSGLEYLVVSLDGTSSESYLKYRIRGDYDKVVSNMAELIRRRNARGRKTPVVEWQFIVMKTNEHEVAEAEQMAKKLGVDVMRFIPVGMPFEFRNRKDVADLWYPTQHEGRQHSEADTEQQFGQAEKPSPCFYLYRSMVVNPDGGVSPCCVVYRKNRDFAQLDDKPVDVGAIWNNEKYQSARSLFSEATVEKRRPTVCDTCDIFAFHPSKGKPKRLPATAPIEFHRERPPAP